MIPSKIDPNETITCQGWEIKKLVLEAQIKEVDYLMRLRDELGRFKIADRMVLINRKLELQELTKGGSDD